MPPPDCRSVTADVCEQLVSDRATRRTRRAERKLQKSLRRAEARECHLAQVQVMAHSIRKATGEYVLLQARNRELEETDRALDALERIEDLVAKDFADPEVAELLKTLAVSESRTHAARSAAQKMGIVACKAIEDAEESARATMSKALQRNLEVRAKLWKKPMASGSTQTDPQDHSQRVVLSTQQISCSQPELKPQQELSGRNEAAARQDALGAGLRLWHDEEKGRGAVKVDMQKEWQALSLHAPSCGQAGDGAEDSNQLRRELAAERQERKEDICALQDQVAAIMKQLGQSASQGAGSTVAAGDTPGASSTATGRGLAPFERYFKQS